ncbi:hypothetical protein [Alicyclobacillus acidocaldarius]|uniref:Uncharacterized protein n=1 Tax=Alicyclobacillus acidocaldarius (strain Tc-4-1) TaxID=1048834 RepID=F8IH36_ALIAT|nr:hypothetical protein [Alicyclobacillus acidocaldarius]AEJ44390.1 hypothetical protein TC41_2491 [Alicyclobacillus acidocaldarius subsp. acidocaldarius Tc-4-1]
MFEFAVWEQGRVRMKRGLCLGVVEEGEYPPVYEGRGFRMAYDPNKPCDETRLLMAVPRFCKVSVVHTIYLVVPQAVTPKDREALRQAIVQNSTSEAETICGA